MALVVRAIAHTTFIGVPEELLPQDDLGYEGVIRACQDIGTDAERLVECAGRACYDSYGKGRDSSSYHQHIMDVDHGSVTEHATISFFLSGMSRGCTHELVRHRVGVAISQRSTRYVDESSSDYAHHPLLRRMWDERPESRHTSQDDAVYASRRAYDDTVLDLEGYLIEKGTDKFTARKQARGAARGFLGNALSTEMVWTCNLRTLKTVLGQRAKAAADAEIRLLANRLYEEALPYWPTYLGRYQKRHCPDGIGYELHVPDPRDEKIATLEAQLGKQKA